MYKEIQPAKNSGVAHIKLSDSSTGLSCRPNIQMVSGEYSVTGNTRGLFTDKFDYNGVADIISHALRSHREITISMGNSPAGQFEGRSRVFPLTDQSELKGSIIGEFPGDRHSIELLQQELEKLQGVEIDKLIIIAESHKADEGKRPYTATSALKGVAERLDIQIANSVYNILNWKTIAKAASLSHLSPPSVAKDQVAGFYVMKDALRADGRLRYDLLAGVEKVSSAWAENIAVEKLYCSAYYQMDVNPGKQSIFMKLVQSAARDNGGVFPLGDREAVERILNLGRSGNPSLDRWELMGGLTLLASPFDDRQGFPNYFLEMNKGINRWQHQTTVEELHRGIVALRELQEKAPIDYHDRVQSIGVLTRKAQNVLTTNATLTALRSNPKSNAVIVLCGRYRVEGVQNALKRY